MKKDKNSKKIIAIAVVVVVAVAAAPYFTGKMIQKRIEHDVALLNQKLEPFTKQKESIQLEYQSGWFSSKARTTFKNVVIDHNITHGPYCTFGIAKIDSTFELPQKLNEELTQFFDGKKPYSLITKINFSNSAEVSLTSPNIGQKVVPKNPNASITWEGLNYTTKFSTDSVESSFSLPNFEFTDKNSGSFVIYNVKSQSTTGRFFDENFNFHLPKDLNFNGQASIDKISLISKNPYNPASFQINNISTSTKQSNKDNAYISNFSIDNFSAKSRNGEFSIGKINLNSSSQDPLWIIRDNVAEQNWNSQFDASINDININIPEEDIKARLNIGYMQQVVDNKNTVSFSERYSANNIDISTPEYSNIADTAELAYTVNGLPKKAIANVIDGYINLFTSGYNAMLDSNNDFNSMLGLYLENMQTIETRKEQFVVATLQQTPDIAITAKTTGKEGNANLDLKAALIKPDNSTTDLQQLLMQVKNRVNSTLAINLSESLVDKIASMKGLSPEELAQVKAQLVERIPFINKNGVYTLDLEFKDDSFSVNGQVEPDFLQKYSQPF